ncbi:COG1361 S-layer family protein [Archaeoglobus sp.]
MLRLLRLIILVTTLMTISVASAQDIDFHVSIAGSNKLNPGDDTYITIVVENEGKANGFTLNENTSNLLPLVTTAKDLRVEIEDDYIPIKVESANPQIVGDLPSGRIAKIVFRVRVDENAKLGEYRIPIKLKYTKVTYTPTTSGVTLYYHEDEVDVEYLKVEITKKDYDFSVVNLKSNLRTSEEGLVEVTVKNSGRFKLSNVTLVLNVTPPLKPNPSAISTYLGDLYPEEVAKAKFKVYVMENALSQIYPAKLLLFYKLPNGETTVLSKSVGLNVCAEDTFTVKDVKCFVTPAKFFEGKRIPSRGFVKITIVSNANVSDAVAVLTFETPLLQAENSPFLGDIRKGESRNVTFYVKSLAFRDNYRAILTIRYTMFGDDLISEKHYIDIKVDSSPLRVEKVESVNLAVGGSGDVLVALKNNLNRAVKDLELAVLTPKSMKPLSPTYYIPTLRPHEVEEAKFRLAVSGEASSGSYMLYLIESFDLDGIDDLTCISGIPVFVKSKVANFEVVSVKSLLYPDETGDVVVEIRNIGNVTIHNGVVELYVSTPLTIAGGSALSGLIGKAQPGLYFIGTLRPNDVAIAKFRVDVDKDAGAGYYPAIVKIRYDDDEGYTHESNPITVSLEVREKPILNPVTISATILIALAVFVSIRFVKRRAK